MRVSRWLQNTVGKSRDEFARFRAEYVAQLSLPRFIVPSLQVSERAGEIPHDDGCVPMLKVPINGLLERFPIILVHILRR